ncbi:GRIP1-associated protein 1 [Portunus trituberculatus]|uniref:GRIP1-associated protein 1 n=1 Tax=Portunus trituberculatus TaxID=210409 RepID=A0A5B7CGA1_PORTR|nr:GRIP1-associated protein 1 [Portunus trituberculatus]
MGGARSSDVHCPSEGRQMNQLMNQPISRPRKAADPVHEPANQRVAPSTLHILTSPIKHWPCRSFLNSSEEASAELVGNKLTSLHLTHVEELKQSLGDVESKLTECRSNLAEKCARYEAALDSVQQLEHKLQSAEEGVLEARNATLHKAKECQGIEIDGKIMELSDLNTKLMQLQQEKITLMEFNEKLKGDVEVAQKKAQEDLDRVTAEKCQDIENLKWEYKKEKSDLHTQLEISTIQRQEAEDTVEALKRKVADGEEEQRIHERKGVTLLKDLKKQLMAERKRADRLQEKLSQLLTDPAQLTAITISDKTARRYSTERAQSSLFPIFG